MMISIVSFVAAAARPWHTSTRHRFARLAQLLLRESRATCGPSFNCALLF
jgi:hypothetical protein